MDIVPPNWDLADHAESGPGLWPVPYSEDNYSMSKPPLSKIRKKTVSSWTERRKAPSDFSHSNCPGKNRYTGAGLDAVQNGLVFLMGLGR